MDSEDLYDDNVFDWAEEGSDNNEPNYSASSSRRKHYKILKEEDIKQLQQKDISTVSGVLSVSRGVACSLLYEDNWSLTSVYEKWFAVKAEEGAGAAMPTEPESCKQVCKICYRKTNCKLKNMVMVSSACGHPFCAKCWKKYIATAINDGVGCLTLRCPEPGCKAAVGLDMIDSLASADEKDKYYAYLRRSYVERSRNRKWCPSRGCDRAIEFDAFKSESYDVACDCSNSFCWSCGEESHRPVDCKTAAEWLRKCVSMSEEVSRKWILAYTKPCPKCCRAVYKYGGCNHIVCPAPCGFDFCWACLQRHGGGLHIHNDYEEEEKKKKEEVEKSTNITMMMKLSGNHARYYEKWNSDDKWRRMPRGPAELGSGWCLFEAAQLQLAITEEIAEWRRVVKWSYVHGFFSSLEKENSKKERSFDCLLEKAEKAAESLHKKIDGGISCEDINDNEFRINLIDQSLLTRKYFEDLLQHFSINMHN